MPYGFRSEGRRTHCGSKALGGHELRGSVKVKETSVLDESRQRGEWG